MKTASNLLLNKIQHVHKNMILNSDHESVVTCRRLPFDVGI